MSRSCKAEATLHLEAKVSGMELPEGWLVIPSGQYSGFDHQILLSEHRHQSAFVPMVVPCEPHGYEEMPLTSSYSRFGM